VEGDLIIVKKTLIAIVIGSLTGFAALAQETAKQDLKKSGQDIKQAGKDTGRATKNAAKGVKKGTKKGVNKAAGKTQEGAAKVKSKTEEK
jgi:hypothetical protein